MTEAAAFVYLLRCRDDSLYTGISNDVSARIDAHNDGRGARYTRGRRPVTLLHVETFDTRGAALSRECAIKRLSRRDKVRLCGTTSAADGRMMTVSV